jgi:indolepyruvate ferredoxin oxidoreductase
VIPLNNPLKNVTDIIEDRASRLMAYRDASYAQQYRNYLNQIGEKDAEVGANDQLTRAVSKYLFKVMAYKDEYEVARLQTDVSFQRELDNIFEGDYKIEYHLAPPMLSKTDDNGQPV